MQSASRALRLVSPLAPGPRGLSFGEEVSGSFYTEGPDSQLGGSFFPCSLAEGPG